MEKKWKTKMNGKIVLHGAKGYNIGQVGTKKWKNYCARSLGITKKFLSAQREESPNYQSRRKWRCPLDKLEK